MPLQPGFDYDHTTVQGPRHDVPSAVACFIGFSAKPAAQPDLPLWITDMVEFEHLLGGPPSLLGNSDRERRARCSLYYTMRLYFDNGGMSCYVLPVGDYSQVNDLSAEALVDKLSRPELFAALDRLPDISLVALPDVALFADTETPQLLQVWGKTMSACERYPQLFALLDPPAAFAGAKACMAWLDTTREGASRAAAWWPWLLGDYPGVGRLKRVLPLPIPASGAVCAHIQRTDRDIGVWKAPANGKSIAAVIQPQHSYLLGQQLFEDDRPSINLIRAFPGRGTKVWGCRTLAQPSLGPAALYVQARRLATYIQKNLRARAMPSVFDPNNEITWLTLKSGLGLWLRKLWYDGGLVGNVEEDAYQLQIGVDESMTVQDLTEGRLLVNVLVAFHYPAEFIHLSVELHMNTDVIAQQGMARNRSDLS